VFIAGVCWFTFKLAQWGRDVWYPAWLTERKSTRDAETEQRQLDRQQRATEVDTLRSSHEAVVNRLAEVVEGNTVATRENSEVTRASVALMQEAVQVMHHNAGSN
jgi:hypothetical protein